MNYNNPDAKDAELNPVTYILEEYEPNGMEGLMIVNAELEVEIDYSCNEPYIDSIRFEFDGKVASCIPREFTSALIKIIHADDKLMERITDACINSRSNDLW